MNESTVADSAPLPANVRGERQDLVCADSAAAIPRDPPDAMREYLKQPGARYYGEFRFWDDPTGGARLVQLRNMAPEDHLIQRFESGPNSRRVEYICSAPAERGNYGSSEYGLPDSPYPQKHETITRSAA